MNSIECTVCGDTLVLAEPGDSIPDDAETILSHTERTSHELPLDFKHVIECKWCGHTWRYGGSARRATCSSCRNKTPVE